MEGRARDEEDPGCCTGVHEACELILESILMSARISNFLPNPNVFQPYGNYNNRVREASIIRNQSLVIWDFECVLYHTIPESRLLTFALVLVLTSDFSHPLARHSLALTRSPGDSLGVSASVSQQRYTDVANRRPSTILALNHETYASTA